MERVPAAARPLPALPWWAVDLLLALFILGPAPAPAELGDAPGTPALFLLGGLAVGCMLVRRRLPVVAVVAALALGVLVLAVHGPVFSAILGSLVCLFHLAAVSNRRTTVIYGCVSVLVWTAAAPALLPRELLGFHIFVQIIALCGFAGAAGDAARSRREYLDSLIDRARRAEESKEAEALRRVSQTRLSIARDLHDVMAHQIAVISMHANVASQLMRGKPEEAEKSLLTIRESARTVLSEIGGLLAVLREGPAAEEPPSERRPVPGLKELDPLVSAFIRDGLDVEVRTEGVQVQLPEPVDVVAYSAIREALTNAHKHGADSTALLNIDYGAPGSDSVEITVTNTTPLPRAAAASLPGGHGLLGAKERVASVRGALETSYGPGPVHRFTARLPKEVHHDLRDAR